MIAGIGGLVGGVLAIGLAVALTVRYWRGKKKEREEKKRKELRKERKRRRKRKRRCPQPPQPLQSDAPIEKGNSDPNLKLSQRMSNPTGSERVIK